MLAVVFTHAKEINAAMSLKTTSSTTLRSACGWGGSLRT